jgi:hypothetical protein
MDLKLMGRDCGDWIWASVGLRWNSVSIRCCSCLNITLVPCSCFTYISFYYQLLHNKFIHSYLFRLTISAIIRQSSYTDISSVQRASEW